MPAASPLYEVIPRHTQFQIGRDLDAAQANDPLVGIVKLEGVLEQVNPADGNAPANLTLLCAVRNTGDANFTLEVEESANNNSTGVGGGLTPDPYAAREIRVDGVAVGGGTVVVVPGGVVVFAIEHTAGDDPYLKFEVPEGAAFGELTLAHYNGTLVIRERTAQP